MNVDGCDEHCHMTCSRVSCSCTSPGVSLARALYTHASLYLLDDPFSALDADIAHHVFHHIQQHTHATRIIVTHAIELVTPHADWIVVMREGRVYAQGSYAEMMQQCPHEMMQHATRAKQDDVKQAHPTHDTQESTHDSASQPTDDKQDTSASLITTEEQSFGVVHGITYMQYARAMGIPCLMLALLLQGAQQACDFCVSWWLTQWTDDTQQTHAVTYYISIYASLTGASALLILAYQICVVLCGYRTSMYFHTAALTSVVAAPLQWFDATPVGRLLSRFSRDLDVIDDDLQFTIALLWTTICSCLAVLIAITYVTPLFLITAIPLTCIYLSIQAAYRPASRELNRLVNVARSPVYALITETCHGVDTIRCYTRQWSTQHGGDATRHLMIDRLRELIAQHIRALMLQIALKRW